MRKDVLEFDLTEDHIKLISNMYVDWDSCMAGAPAVDCKRPYGNSAVESDVAELLGWEVGADGMNEEAEAEAARIHRETEYALQIVLKMKSFEPGKFKRDNTWSDWKKA
jgi:hypothetical protein